MERSLLPENAFEGLMGMSTDFLPESTSRWLRRSETLGNSFAESIVDFGGNGGECIFDVDTSAAILLRASQHGVRTEGEEVDCTGKGRIGEFRTSWRVVNNA